MNAKERLLATVMGEPADRAPFICPGGMMTMVVVDVMDELGFGWPEAHSDAEMMADLTLGCSRLSGVENTGVPFCMTVEAESMGASVTLGGRTSEPRVTEYAIDRLEDVAKLRPLDPSTGRARVCVEAIRLLKDRAPELPVIANVTGPVSVATSLVDPLICYRALCRDKERAHALLRVATDAAAVFADAMIAAGADAVCIADPSATGEIIGRDAFEEFALVYLNELADRVRDRCGTPSIVHICGDVKMLDGALASISADVVSIDSLVGIDALRERVDGKVTMGNVSTYLLERGRPAEVLKAARGRLRAGVNILAPACGISPRTPIANVRSMAEAVAGE